ncbi:tetraacyldisaccharide 4'-kinase [Candidatus Bandiella euplotis]|uniref:Tetraacyldisaccharide 4'-kinase n=1 Tax=Candidatus Bandiella euplotis TaxID=1664265 RepID=A0ABZ0UQ67_9RICK|nr:tetraacyldisaccharide 4'-kinase [Candidatus Bandiella woodruffii]WPX97050.1 Tetraacyldisaccharide 4'-kinase [Candidatus Bandiella woodruffii]
MRTIDKLANYIQSTLWFRVTLINYLLLPFSLVYSLIRNLRYYFFQTPVHFKSKVICVGNSVSGGAGKTPVVIRLAILLKEGDKKVAVVARGYKGVLSNSKEAIKVDLDKHSYREVGDETMLVAKYADVFISANRALAIKEAQKYGAEIIILDDGFQDNTIHKDLSILVISSAEIKNKFLIPAGPMRESLNTSLKKADIVIVPENKQYALQGKYLVGKEVLKQGQVISNAKELEGNQYILLCAIAQPDRVVTTARELGAIIKKKHFYPDHYSFSERELKVIYKQAQKYNCKVLTTTKDYVRLPQDYLEDTAVLKYYVEFDDEEKLREKIYNLFD